MTKATASEPKVELPQRQYDAMQSQMLELKQSNEALKQQLDWFKRQVFGTKSEKRAVANGEQAALFQGAPPAQTDDGPAPITVRCTVNSGHRMARQLAAVWCGTGWQRRPASGSRDGCGGGTGDRRSRSTRGWR